MRSALLNRRAVAFLVVAMLAMTAVSLHAAEPVTLDNVEDPGKNLPDEPLAEAYSLQQAVHFLDSAAVSWQKTRNCMTCHTNYLYLMARPMVDADVPAHETVREYAEKLITDRWPERGPRWDAEVAMTAAVLAHNDAATTGELHPLARQALDRMWTVQREDGGIEWLKCDWPPMEHDDYFGATIMALAAGVAPDDYAQTPAAAEGLAKLREYFAANEPPSLHHQGMLAWVSTYVDGILDDAARQSAINELLALQHDDGGWGLAQLGPFERHDGAPQDLDTSDGYGTGFVIFIARQCGIAADHPQLARGIAWLKQNQRASGRWFTRSAYKDNTHFITHAGTNWAVMALAACGAAADAPVRGR